MSIIRIENLTFSYPSGFCNVFENVGLSIDTDWKLGFIGRNGRGKTTLLKLLAGEYEYSGKIVSSVKFSYFPYTVKDCSRFTWEILEEICPQAEDWQIARELSLLEVRADALYMPFEYLSNGERTKVLLAALFLNEGNFLLIDEPTNHLDYLGRQAVAKYLKSKKGFILVSHDRQFLDGCIDHVLALNRAGMEVQSGNFSSWQENSDRRQSFEQTQNEKLKKDIARLSAAARRTSDWADKTESSKYGKQSSGLKADRGYVGHKSAKMMKRAKVAEAHREQAIELKSALLKNTEECESLKLFPLKYRAERLAYFKDVTVSYGGKAACKHVSFEVKNGDRIALDGSNGSGKSSLLKLLVTGGVEYTGEVKKGSGLIISYIPQDTSNLSGSLSSFAAQAGIDESLFKAILNKLDFDREQLGKDISEFSAGQKKKVLIAKSLSESAHLYVWDEPLNYIDVFSRMQIERLLAEFRPTMIFVEHDAAFRENIATDIVRL